MTDWRIDRMDRSHQRAEFRCGKAHLGLRTPEAVPDGVRHWLTGFLVNNEHLKAQDHPFIAVFCPNLDKRE
jgi:hypothetical protein